MGDPRFSFLWWIVEDQPNGPLGYGPSSVDPAAVKLLVVMHISMALLLTATLDQLLIWSGQLMVTFALSLV